MKKGIIIFGSANSFGETRKLADYIKNKSGFPLIDLKTKKIGEFDYEYKNKDDDYLPLIKDIAENYELIIIATPVYWYSMSGIMKTFYDRFSDCLHAEKETGRKLRGKNMAVLSCGSDKKLKEGYYMPFKESANYLGMNYLADVHGWIENKKISDDVQNRLDEFIYALKSG